ncbi:FHA domain-containing protein [Variovorax sp. KK3]|uniref:FHA domain-containing protein n=1 Tax=Variovorax sp. KK3 TaxID=1855728 RepID=UPI00097BE2A0|nr:FHA domain-containing protein [Variovorax sp. KK3]
MPRLIVLARNSSVRQINIAGPSTTIGRALSNRVCIDSDKVSRQHALIEWSGDRYVLNDLGSRNGCYVNGDRVQGSRPLANGDAIMLGDCQLRFLYTSKVLPTTQALSLVTVASQLERRGAAGRAVPRPMPMHF